MKEGCRGSWSSADATSCVLKHFNATGAGGFVRRNATGVCVGSVTSADVGLAGSCQHSPLALGSHHWFIDCTGVGGVVHTDMYHTVVSTTTASASASDLTNLANALSALESALNQLIRMFSTL